MHHAARLAQLCLVRPCLARGTIPMTLQNQMPIKAIGITARNGQIVATWQLHSTSQHSSAPLTDAAQHCMRCQAHRYTNSHIDVQQQQQHNNNSGMQTVWRKKQLSSRMLYCITMGTCMHALMKGAPQHPARASTLSSSCHANALEERYTGHRSRILTNAASQHTVHYFHAPPKAPTP